MTKCQIDYLVSASPNSLLSPQPNGFKVSIFEKIILAPETGYVSYKGIDELQKLNTPTTQIALDFFTIASAITAADSFFKREVYSQNSWAREFQLRIPVVEVRHWDSNKELLKRTMDFLTRDSWEFEFVSGGRLLPNLDRKFRNFYDLTEVDCVSLFSGGLDSWLGAKKLIGDSRRPILVSHAYPKDRNKQENLFNQLGNSSKWFKMNLNPRRFGGNMDTTMRGRSINFIALGALVAEAARLKNKKTEIDLYIPENGFIALNAPLSPRRIGSHSTRTAHPFYLDSLQELFDRVGIQVKIINPFYEYTKGQMLINANLSQDEKQQSLMTVSCGKWKRKNQQCGKCVPCLIRRASFHAANIQDNTQGRYQFEDLSALLNSGEFDKSEDLIAVIRAIKVDDEKAILSRCLSSGKLPEDNLEREKWLNVHKSGITELRDFLQSCNIPL